MRREIKFKLKNPRIFMSELVEEHNAKKGKFELLHMHERFFTVATWTEREIWHVWKDDILLEYIKGTDEVPILNRGKVPDELFNID
jgi:hypothetical protein